MTTNSSTLHLALAQISPVWLNKKATTETLIKVMDASRAAGVFDVSIAAQEG